MVKFALEHTTKAQRGSRGTDPWPRRYPYPLYRRLGGSQGRSRRVRKISPPPGFDPGSSRPLRVAIPTALSRPTPRICYIHISTQTLNRTRRNKQNLFFFFSTQLVTRLSHFSLLCTAYSSLTEDTLGLVPSFTNRCSPVSIRRRRVVQQQYAYMLPYGLWTENALYDSKCHQRQLRLLLAASKFQSSWTLRLKISTSVDHLKGTQKESIPDLIMKWRLYRCKQTFGPFSFSAGIEKAVNCWDKRSTGLVITCRNRVYCMFSISISK